MKDVLGNKVEFASQATARQLRVNMDRIIRAIAVPMEWDEDDLAHVWVTDESRLSDFCLDDDEIVSIATQLNVKIESGDLLVDIARKLGAN